VEVALYFLLLLLLVAVAGVLETQELVLLVVREAVEVDGTLELVEQEIHHQLLRHKEAMEELVLLAGQFHQVAVAVLVVLE
jgi:hypothetical protein